MRSYLYLWNDAPARCLVASGVELIDLVPTLRTGGLRRTRAADGVGASGAVSL